jgi:hypothetical protein
LILLAFLLPFSVYLLILGIVNRRSHPVLVPGTWDFVGILFAASGFLLVVGPAIITSASERWRVFWLFGTQGGGVPPLDDETVRSWGMLAVLYFGLVVLGAVYLLRARRGLTAVYNVEAEAFENALAQAFGALGLKPLRSGHLFVLNSRGSLEAVRQESITDASPSDRPIADDASTTTATAAVLDVDPFRVLRHVSLRWEPIDAPLRRVVENELERTLARVPSTNHAVGDWFVLLALALIAFNLFATFGLTVSSFVRR